jgi:hypothetical protein
MKYLALGTTDIRENSVAGSKALVLGHWTEQVLLLLIFGVWKGRRVPGGERGTEAKEVHDATDGRFSSHQSSSSWQESKNGPTVSFFATQKQAPVL